MRRIPRLQTPALRATFALLVLLMSSAGPLSAGDADYAFDPLSDTQVLSQSSIHAFAQDRRGYLWIGTQFGLDRYDGFELRRYQHDPADPESLSGNFIRDLLLDRDGMLWVGSGAGLDRLDPLSGKIVRHRFATEAGESTPIRHPAVEGDSLVELPNGTIMAVFDGRPTRVTEAGKLEHIPVDDYTPEPVGTALTLDPSGRAWFASDAGLWRHDSERGCFVPLIRRTPDPEHRHGGPHLIAPGPSRTMAYVHRDGLTLVDIDRGHAIRDIRPSELGAESDHVDAVALDSTSHLWLATPTELLRLPPDLSGPWQSFPIEALHGPNPHQRISVLFLEQSPTGQVWLSGRFGVVRYDPIDETLTRWEHDPANPRSLPPTLGEIGYRIFLDHFDVLWVGSNLGGLARRPPQRDRFVHVRDSTPTSISRNIVRGITEQRIDGQEYVWVANQNHGVVVWRRTGERRYEIAHHYPVEDHAGDGDRIRQLLIDPSDRAVWIVGQTGLRRARRPGDPLEPIPGVTSDPTRGSIRMIRFIDRDQLAIGFTRALSLVELDPERGPRKTLFTAELGENYQIYSFTALDRSRLITAGFGGARIIDLARNRVTQLLPGGPDPNRPGNQLFSVAVDRDQRVWLGTRDSGLIEIDPNAALTVPARFIGPAEGLPDATVYAILPDDSGMLWLSSNRGITRYRPEDGLIQHYSPTDGVQAWEFNSTVGHVGESGRFYFGGINGWNAFRPGTVRDLLRPPSVQIESVQVNQQNVEIGAAGSTIRLGHDHSQLSIDYVGLHFAEPSEIRYAYRLRGLNDAWLDVGAVRQARWGALPPGRYEFQLRAANLDGIWSPPSSLLRLEVSPAPWNTVWARLVYLAAITGLLLLLLRYQHQKRQRLQLLIARRTSELARQKDVIETQAARLRDALDARTLMFANVSHEFRTPLTLIRASIDRLERAPDSTAANQGRRYINRLLRLVEQLLDLSRLRLTETHSVEPPWRLDSLVSQTIEAFRPVAEQRRQHLSYSTGGAWHTECLREAVERILINLVANAVKFTPAGGTITVTIEPDPAGAMLEVADTGPGIPEHQHELIFHRFYRTASAAADQAGTGIGLALVHEAVRSIGGRIEIISAAGEGARFRVRLAAGRPLQEMPLRSVEVDAERQQLDLDALAEDPTPATAAPKQARSVAGRHQPALLIVDDNADLRRHLAESLGHRWRVSTADNGEQGYVAAARLLPDMIVTDLMMPDVDGFEMLQRLRNNIATSHIPVLFLTARQDQETRLRAFSLSADGFLSKPFDERELEARIEQLLLQRKRIQAFLRRSRLDRSGGAAETIGPATPASAPGEAVAARDRQLLNRLDSWIERHYADPNTDIEGMAAALHMSPRNLQRKLKGLTGQTPASRLRDMRLAHARERLVAEDRSVTEIGLECGFSSVQYFSRVFRRQFGIAPDQWRRRARPD